MHTDPVQLLAFATSFAMVGICTALAQGGGADPLTVVMLRTIGTVALFLAWFRLMKVPLTLSPRERAVAAAIGIPLCINNYLLNLAIAEIPVPLVVLLFYLWPAITTSVSWLAGKERFGWMRLAGLVTAFAGVALALNVDFTAAQMKGVWLALGASVAWSATFLLTSHFFHGRDTRPATLHMTATAAVVFVIGSLFAGGVNLPHTAAGWSGILGVPFFYAFAMIGLFSATARLGPMRVGFFMNFEPIVAVVLAALILGQRLEPVQLAGGALVVAALFLFRPPPAIAAGAGPAGSPPSGAPRRSAGAESSRTD
ncbi:MAG TPA: DMT family transporter [Burkholderiales bacterium]|nr:DMT family transporter [Burkholderiales bacterium]